MGVGVHYFQTNPPSFTSGSDLEEVQTSLGLSPPGGALPTSSHGGVRWEKLSWGGRWPIRWSRRRTWSRSSMCSTGKCEFGWIWVNLWTKQFLTQILLTFHNQLDSILWRHFFPPNFLSSLFSLFLIWGQLRQKLISPSIGSGSWQPWRKSLKSSWRYSRRWTGENWDQIWVCLKIGYIPNYSHLIGIMIINHWVFRGTQHFQTNPFGPGMPRSTLNIPKELSPGNHRSQSSKQSANKSRIFRRRQRVSGSLRICGEKMSKVQTAQKWLEKSEIA